MNIVENQRTQKKYLSKVRENTLPWYVLNAFEVSLKIYSKLPIFGALRDIRVQMCSTQKIKTRMPPESRNWGSVSPPRAADARWADAGLMTDHVCHCTEHD